ncbi:MAG: DUF354 domain-containing protein [Bacteroidales bacterium]|nr:DUF354 domain-containing protein [Bacteroidales bacterium]
MRILIDIGHPAHVHLFKHFAHAMIKTGHQVHFTARTKESVAELLNHEGFLFTSFGRHYKSKAGKIWGLTRFSWLMLQAGLKYRPDIYISHGSMYAAFVSFLLHKTHIALEDTGNREQVRLYLPFTKVVLTSTCFPSIYGKKQIFYDSYHELAYLHPNHFTPDKSILRELGLKENEPYAILRFVSWNASHDAGEKGLGYEEKAGLVKKLSSMVKVFVSSEGELTDELAPYRISIPPWRMHDALAFASLFVGEGATMASECAVLGVPAVYINTQHVPYVVEQQNRYGLAYCFKNSKGLVETVQKILSGFNKTDWQEKRKKLLHDKIDTAAFLVWFVTEYPESIQIMKRNPEFQQKFK